MVHVSVWQAELRDAIIGEVAQLKGEVERLRAALNTQQQHQQQRQEQPPEPNAYDALLGPLPQSHGAGQMTTAPFDQVKPSTWPNGNLPGTVTNLCDQITTRLGVGPNSKPSIREHERFLRLWAESVDSGCGGKIMGSLGDALFSHLRVAVVPGAFADDKVRKALIGEEFPGDDLGAALAQTRTRGRQDDRRRGKGSRSGSRERRCFACGDASHVAWDCSDKEKKAKWLADGAKRPGFRRGAQ